MNTIQYGRTDYGKVFTLILVEGEASECSDLILENDDADVASRFKIADTERTLWVTHGEEDGSMMDAETITQEAKEDDLVIACYPMQCADTHPDLKFVLDHHKGEVGLEALGDDKDTENPVSVMVVDQYVSLQSEVKHVDAVAYSLLETYLERDVNRAELDMNDIPF